MCRQRVCAEVPPCFPPCCCLQAIQLINTLTKELDIHAAMESVRHVALELLECERVTLFLVIESRQELRWDSSPLQLLVGS
jgi:hypothetical protein